MSVPFSSTHLRVPRGFGTILEGLTREVLRDQPEDIPKYAADYFSALLTKREESGMDPAEWAAKLEDRSYNNHAFKTSSEKVPTTEVTLSEEKSYESLTEDESSHSAKTSVVYTTQPNLSKEADLTGSMEEEEKHNITEKEIISLDNGTSQEELINRFPVTDVQSDELSGREEKDPTATTLDQVDSNEKDNSSVSDQAIPQSELQPTGFSSFSGISNVDVCAQELGTEEDEQGETFHEENTLVDDTEIEESEGEESTKDEEPVEAFPYSGIADVDVCVTELGEIDKITEEAAVDDGENVVQSSLSPSETFEGNQQEPGDQADKTIEKEGTEAEASSSGETDETLAQIEGSLVGHAIPKEDSLVEINFEDVPDAQQITEFEEKLPEDEGSEAVLSSVVSEMQEHEESNEACTLETDQNISGAQALDKPALEGALKEVNAETEDMEKQQGAYKTMYKMVDSNHSDLNDSGKDDEEGEGVKNIISSHQPTTEAGEESPEEESDLKIEDNDEMSGAGSDQNEDSQKETKSNDPEVKEEEMASSAGEDTDGHTEVKDEEMNHVEAENKPSQITQPHISKAGMEAEGEILQASAQHLPEENGEGTFIEPKPEHTEEEKEVTFREATSEAEEPVEEGKIDSDAQRSSDEMCISPTQSADQGEQRPHGSEKHTAEPEGQRRGKEECSHPQDEEDIMDIPLDDPEANRAAAKIQAGFRGHMTRKKMKPEDKAEGEEVSSTGDVLNGSQGDTETGGSGAIEGDDTSVPEQ